MLFLEIFSILLFIRIKKLSYFFCSLNGTINRIDFVDMLMFLSIKFNVLECEKVVLA